MSIYLVDFENVTSEGLSGVDKLGEGDKVVLFYSTKANKISMPIHVEMSKSLASFEYKEVSVGGKNALDYQLSTYLGYLIGQKEDRNFYIVSKDRGYEYLSDFWKQTLGETKEQINIELIGAIKEVRLEGNEPIIESHKGDKTIENPNAEANNNSQENKEINQSVAPQENKTIHEAAIASVSNSNRNRRYGVKNTNYTNKRKTETTKPMSVKAEVSQKANDSKPTIVVRENVFSSSETPKIKDTQTKAIQTKVVQTKTTQTKTIQTVEVEKQLRQLIDKELQEDQVKRIVQCFKQAKNKQELHRRMVKVLGQDRGTVLYHRIKKLVKDKEA